MPYWNYRGGMGYIDPQMMRSEAIRRMRDEQAAAPGPKITGMWGDWLDRIREAGVPSERELETLRPEAAGAFMGGYTPRRDVSLGGQLGMEAIGSNQATHGMSTAGPGQQSIYEGALRGLEGAYGSTTGRAQERIGGELQRRFPFQYGTKSGY